MRQRMDPLSLGMASAPDPRLRSPAIRPPPKMLPVDVDCCAADFWAPEMGPCCRADAVLALKSFLRRFVFGADLASFCEEEEEPDKGKRTRMHTCTGTYIRDTHKRGRVHTHKHTRIHLSSFFSESHPMSGPAKHGHTLTSVRFIVLAARALNCSFSTDVSARISSSS